MVKSPARFVGIEGWRNIATVHEEWQVEDAGREVGEFFCPIQGDFYGVLMGYTVDLHYPKRFPKRSLFYKLLYTELLSFWGVAKI